MLEVVQLSNTPLKDVLYFPITTTLLLTQYSKDKHQYELQQIKKIKK